LPFIPKVQITDPHNLRLLLKINGIIKQDGTTADMTFRIPRLIEHISSIMTLEEGDLILTGTPSGVGPVVAGDKVECLLTDAMNKGLAKLDFTAVARQGGYSFHSD
jgi:acylpyruvate hydrolase